MTITLGADWTDVSTAASMTAAGDYTVQAQEADVFVTTRSTDSGTPDGDDRGFILYDEGEMVLYEQKANKTLWARRRPDGTTFSAILQVEAA